MTEEANEDSLRQSQNDVNVHKLFGWYKWSKLSIADLMYEKIAAELQQKEAERKKKRIVRDYVACEVVRMQECLVDIRERLKVLKEAEKAEDGSREEEEAPAKEEEAPTPEPRHKRARVDAAKYSAPEAPQQELLPMALEDESDDDLFWADHLL
eukprot:TRINITY_DN38105_c0_g1_i1.p1 TRINITY_DN38105_c0_g1~~TRINITY_DN38105_c0_g1_i1.p1  ORF type:complete len:169 (+),score=42.24 TRINITY_DN38105_c0_g1_i1:46-507(+)